MAGTVDDPIAHGPLRFLGAQLEPGNGASLLRAVQQSTMAQNRLVTSYRLELGVTASELMALRHLWDCGPMRPSQLARATGLSRAAMTALVARLESMGLVERRSDATDRRSYEILPTERSERAMATLLAPAVDELRDMAGEFAAADVTTAGNLLRAIADRYDSITAARYVATPGLQPS